MIADFLLQEKIPFSLIELEAGGVLPDDLTDLLAVVSLGGPMNVYEVDKYPFLRAEDQFIKKIIKTEIPFLGVCLGAQLLAKAAGAKVYKAQQEEIGWFDVAITAEGARDQLFAGLPARLEVFQWHGDTFDLPSWAQLLAHGRAVKNQAFRVGPVAYGLQFHLEVNESIIQSWFKEPENYLTHLNKIKQQYQLNTQKVLACFFAL